MTSPKNARQRGGRVYVWPPTPPYELEVPNVTGIIGKGLPKPFLAPWQAKLVATAAVTTNSWRGILADEGEAAAIDWLKGSPWRYTKKRADVGTEVHSLIEATISGEPLPKVSDEAHDFYAGFVRFVKDFSPSFEHTEVTAYSRTHGYAGTADAIGTVGAFPEWGRLVMDWKTSASLYSDSAMQLAATAHADFLGIEREGKWTEGEVGKIDAGLLVRLTPDGEYDARLANVDETVFATFLHCAGVAAWDRDIAPTALSETIIPEGAAPMLTGVDSPAVRAAVELLRDEGEHTLAGVAGALGISERAARGRLRRAYRDYGLVAYNKDTGLFSYVG